MVATFRIDEAYLVGGWCAAALWGNSPSNVGCPVADRLCRCFHLLRVLRAMANLPAQGTRPYDLVQIPHHHGRPRFVRSVRVQSEESILTSGLLDMAYRQRTFLWLSSD